MPSISTRTDASAAYSASSTAVGRGNASSRPVAGQDEAPVLVAQRTQHVANTGVDRERAVREPAGERLVVDRVPVVEGTDPAVTLRLCEQDLVQGRLVPWVGVAEPPAVAALALDLGDRPEREVQNLEGMPGAQGKEARRLGVVVPGFDLDCGMCAVRDLLVGVEDRLLRARVGGHGETHGHPLGEERAVVRAGQEVSPAAPNDAVARRHGRQDVLERPAAGPPELVRVGVDHPVGVVLGGREARHARDPLGLAHVVTRLAEEPQASRALVPLEDRRRVVGRGIVGRDHEVDPGVQVERDLRVDDVGLVPREERHDDLHGASSPNMLATASTTRSAARPSTTPTTCSTARRRCPASSSGRSSARSIPATTSSKRSAR